MSRMTAAQIISLGEYLEPDFDPASLTVSQLLGVLGYHNIAYPTPYPKPKLVQIFNNEVKSRATKFKKERVKKENSIASEDGITDGVTGEPLGRKGRAPASAPRRSSRRLSQVLKVEEESSPPRPEPPKRRRSSAQPVLGGRSKRMSLAQPADTLVEESEHEDESPVKKVGRTKKVPTASHSRRISHLSGAEDSGWEDNNIFQSGAESSSPARASPVRPKVSRSAAGPRKSRKSTSAPPEMNSSSPIRPSTLSPPQSPFRPSLPPIPKFDFSKPPSTRFTPIREFSPAEPVKAEPEAAEEKYTATDDVRAESSSGEAPELDSVKSEENPDSHALDSQQQSQSQLDEAIAEMKTVDMHQLAPYSMAESSPRHWLLRGLLWIFLLTSLFGVYNYKAESSSIGYCKRGTNTSQALESIFAKRAEEQLCRAKLLDLQNSTEHEQATTKLDCDLPPLVPLPRPSSCAACPDHATCSQFDVTCDAGFLLKPHILLSFIPVSPSNSELTTAYLPKLSETFFKAVSVGLDGLPGFGSIALPPRCVEDPQRKRHIGALGKAIESRLARERGKRVCRGDVFNASESLEGYEAAKIWGVEETQLKEYFRSKATPKVLAHFDDMFNTAIQQLTQWGGVFVGESADGTRYIAHKTPEMSWQCILTVKSREAWAAWRTTVFVSILSVLAIIGMRVKMTQRQKENRVIAELVQVVLDTLRNQEMAHYTDPLTAPEPYLPSLQLRDLILQTEPSLWIRTKLWERVERVVESNANVRANLEEVPGGDEMKVWRWVGSSGRTPGRKGREQEEEGEE